LAASLRPKADERRLHQPLAFDSLVSAEGPRNLTALLMQPVFAVGAAPKAAYAVFAT